ncbi:transcriptional regulator ATRX homolog [Ostrinia furnacalis]|uniref:transcriptional regulator ATRX homolog n=1 Tax=Ostrinia furnacalis TaxID=93504 RepID=UPI00103B3795|nr:transcriptional regulator ATRX homolog [Ostrinia furnacalis]
MADEVPVCDVLCEAMEYLSKLGSNLRARSENLKEKRIRKEKLKNFHAVQKAADKVLLICQLSKKSLENVEVGVRKVLSMVNDSQSSIGVDAVSPAPAVAEPEAKYQYFKYRSRKLRIAKQVPLKHYMSVKVMARKMPRSMQDRYPVYYDCKLYRRRKRKQSTENNENTKRKSDALVERDKTEDMHSKTTKEGLKLESDTKENRIESKLHDKQTSKSNSETEDNDGSNFKDRGKSESSGVCKKSKNDSISKKSDGKDKRLSSESDGKSKNEERSSEKLESKDRRQSLEDKAKNKKQSPEKAKSDPSKKLDSRDKRQSLEGKINKSRRTSESHKKSSSEEASSKNGMESRDKRHSSEDKRKSKDDSSKNSEMKHDTEKSLESKSKAKEDDDDDEIPKKSSKYGKTKFRNIRIIDDDSSENSNDLTSRIKVPDVQGNDNNESVENCENNDSTLQLHKSKKRKLNDSDSETDDNKKSEEESQINSDNIENTPQTEPVKPLIKCVSLTKLLKPDILEKNAPQENTKSKIVGISEKSSENNQNTKNKQNSKQGNNNKIDRYLSKVPSKKDDDYCMQKRKEVSSFVPKNFSIKITRLPELSQNFLQMHNLIKITQNERIVCELIKEKGLTENSVLIVNNQSEEDQNSRSKEASPDNLNVAKSALLDDSESEKSDVGNKSPSPLPITELTENVKNALLNDSDAEKRTEKENEGINRRSQDQDQIKNVLLNDSDSDKNQKENESINVKNKAKTKLLEDFSKIKSTLLNESDSDNHEAADSDKVHKDKSPKNNQDVADEQNSCEPDNSQCQKEVELQNKELSQDKEQNNELEMSKSERKKGKEGKPKSKRKHIMESMHAKKMLLTYSSSSDTEDEQLKNALKEIKDSLLKGISSSDDEKKKKENDVTKNSSSDSEEDILTRAKSSKKLTKEDNTAESGRSGDNEKDDAMTNKRQRDSDETSNDSLNPTKKKMGRSRAQPGGSSKDSDSRDDKDIDGLTNLNSLNKNRRRHGSTSTEKTETNSISSTKKMPKVPLINQEDMLQAETSSEAGSVAESEAGEDLPSISLTGLNGSGGDHLAKDDLLEESDTSGSNNDKEEKKMTDSDEEATMKAKRRKAHATISSDSEAGSSRKKDFADTEAKISDFEDSEDDGSSESNKKNKRRKKAVDSDASVGSSSNDGSKKKRRRIKQLNDSDGSGSDTETEGKNKHGRKNIRKVMGKNQLEEATKKAARQEKERIARIAERQKMYNNLEFDESGKPDEVVLEKVVLDFDPETKKPLIEVDRGLVKKLKPHQANGIKFMWDACFESVKRIKKDKGSGCILAHCMGLGKTLQVVSLTHTLLTHSELTSVQRVLVVCPLSTVLNWVNEFRMWLKHAERDYEVDVYELSRYKQNSERAFQLQQWFDNGGVCVLGYEMFRNLSADNPKKFKKKMLKTFQQSLVDPGPDLVVCDEGHLLKNEKTSLSQSMNRVKTLRRIVLTGTPLQNNLKEYYCMVQFVKPNLLGKYNEYLNRFVNPITNGQYTDSTEHDIRIMKRRSHVLHKMLDGAVQRRDYGVLAPFLPPKHEYVLFITLSEVQCKLYQHYLENYSRRPLPGKSSGFLFPDFQSLQRIWTHPLVLKYNSERYEIMQQKKREREEEDSEGSLVDFIDDDSTPEESSTEESTDELSDMSDDSRKKSKKKKSAKKSKAKDAKVTTRRGTRANPVEMEEDEQNEIVELKNENPTEWWIKLVTEDELEDMRHSHKLVLLFDILRQCEAIGDKLLVFSQSLYSLDLIEHFLGKVDEATQEGRIDEKLGGHVGSWSPGVDYFRLDGSTSCENRSIWCKNFNREDNPRARLFLISTRAGGLGINLVAANRVVIFDVSWNPSHDVQSIFRVYRFGQKKPCYIYRFLVMGTMEEKIYERQVTKQAISKRVIDEQQIDRHYAENDLAELYKFEPTPPQPRPLPPLPKDRLFAEMLREHDKQIYKYHEHDSLLENKEEETLSEEERKAAWEDFENEKNRPPPAPFPSGWPMANGMMSGLIAQQQQQLAYAALAAMLRKDMPNINDNQIRDMLPLIYNANPALMQKMSEIYKYAQPGMMNPMMHPMLAGGGAAPGPGGMSGSSGLQYEPPWQRQQQQQQQQRLQQLLQQNQMGAKYYAGGLGSRDPVAMALQQQRAREMLTGERGRPRGRPPLQPRAPPPHASGDVVNLDSD